VIWGERLQVNRIVGCWGERAIVYDPFSNSQQRAERFI